MVFKKFNLVLIEKYGKKDDELFKSYLLTELFSLESSLTGLENMSNFQYD